MVYASGDGGWFGAAVDMFRQIADAGYPAVGFSSRSFLKIERPRGALVSAAQLADEYDAIVAQARVALGLAEASSVVLVGWSRGAAFSVLVGSEPAAQRHLLGVIAIGLGEGEDLQASGEDDDDGHATAEKRRWPFDTYARIAQLDPLPCAVIQATDDNYLPAASARQLFGPDTPRRRFYTITPGTIDFPAGRRRLTRRFSTRFIGLRRSLFGPSGRRCIRLAVCPSCVHPGAPFVSRWSAAHWPSNHAVQAQTTQTIDDARASAVSSPLWHARHMPR